MDKRSEFIKAAEVLKNGGIVIYPTDTAFGIGCRIDANTAIDKLFTLRRRPPQQAMPVLVSSEQMALTYWLHPLDIVRRLMNAYWPGGLTIVSWAKQDLVYSPVRGGGSTIGLRMPAHELTRLMIQTVGVPILGSSANFHGNPTPFTYTDLDPELTKLVDFVVAGETKGSKMPSTVLDTTTSPAVIVRAGAVQLSQSDLL
jgi:L-threonylcarbamoyladenylate synthase